MKKLTALLGAFALLFNTMVMADTQDEEIRALRQQIELLTKRLDDLEDRSQQESVPAAPTAVASQASSEISLDEKVDKAVAEQVDERLDSVSWAERIRWSGDFRYRYENIDQEDKDGRNRSRIRARTHVEADVSPTVTVGIGLATGGDDPVSSNQTIGGGGSSKDIKIDLAYFDWTGLENTQITGGKFKNFLIRPAKKGLMWDGDWRPEGLGGIWNNDRFFVQGLGTWLEGDSKLGTQFSWVVQAGMSLDVGDSGQLMFGGGYSQFDIAGRTPLFGLPQDFYGNSFVLNPITDELEFKYDYRQWEGFIEYKFKLGKQSMALFADYTVNTEADENDTGYLFGVKYGSAKKKGTWDATYFYEKLEADATIGLLTDSDFGGGGTDAKGHVISGTYAFHSNWNFKATYFINKVKLASTDSKDYNRLMLDLNFKFK